MGSTRSCAAALAAGLTVALAGCSAGGPASAGPTGVGAANAAADVSTAPSTTKAPSPTAAPSTTAATPTRVSTTRPGPPASPSPASPSAVASPPASRPPASAPPASPTGRRTTLPTAPRPLARDAHPGVPGVRGANDVGYLTRVRTGSPARLTYDRVTFHWCTSAELQSDTGCPDDYVITDDNPRLRTSPISAGARLLIQDPEGGGRVERVDVAGLAAAVQGSTVAELVVDDTGTVTAVGIPYLP